MTAGFAAAFATGNAAAPGARPLAQLTPEVEATLGILYVSERAAAALPALVDELAAGTDRALDGGVGLGVCAAGEEVYNRPAAAVLTVAVPEESFRIFTSTGDPASDLPRHHGEWIEAVQPILALLVHADPRCPDLLRATLDAGAASGAFLVGGP